jgi:hypothetical protein
MNTRQVQKIVARMVAEHGTRGLARMWDIDPGYISRIASGEREPGPRILSALGLEADTTYRRKCSKASR